MKASDFKSAEELNAYALSMLKAIQTANKAATKPVDVKYLYKTTDKEVLNKTVGFFAAGLSSALEEWYIASKACASGLEKDLENRADAAMIVLALAKEVSKFFDFEASATAPGDPMVTLAKVQAFYQKYDSGLREVESMAMKTITN